MNNDEVKKIMDKIKEVVAKGNASKIIITNKLGEVVLNVPVTAGVAGVAIGFFTAKWVLIASVIATIGFGCGVEVVNADGQVTKIK